MRAIDRTSGARTGLKVDMHVHTMWSGDSTTTPDELAAGVAASGIDVICITDHNAVAGAVELVSSGELGCQVIVGEEVRTTAGEMIGLFLTERIPFGLKPPEAAGLIRAQGGLVYVPHPFDPMRHCLAEAALRDLAAAGLIDAIEVINGKTSLDTLNAQAAAAAEELGVAAGAGSDAHVGEAVGAAYAVVDDFTDASSFLAALHRGRVDGGHFDPPRPWRPRIVPSTKSH
jgi:predicted metal-dependent phosphoesterase TrpH